jgi:hypothetical protein
VPSTRMRPSMVTDGTGCSVRLSIPVDPIVRSECVVVLPAPSCVVAKSRYDPGTSPSMAKAPSEGLLREVVQMSPYAVSPSGQSRTLAGTWASTLPRRETVSMREGLSLGISCSAPGAISIGVALAGSKAPGCQVRA